MLVKTIITILTVQLRYCHVLRPLGAGSHITICSLPCITSTAALKHNSRSHLWPTWKYHTTFYCWKAEGKYFLKIRDLSLKGRFIIFSQVWILQVRDVPLLNPCTLRAAFSGVYFLLCHSTLWAVCSKRGICLLHFNLWLCQDFPPQSYRWNLWRRYFKNLFLL